MVRSTRPRKSTNIVEQDSDVGFAWWHFVFAIPASAMIVFFGKAIIENFDVFQKGLWKAQLVNLSLRFLERAPVPVARDNMLIEDKLWMHDDSFEAELGVDGDCPFPRILAMNDFNEVDEQFGIPTEMLSQPLVIEGFMESWPATHGDKWQRDKLLKAFGKKAIASKSQTSIVYGGGKTNMKFSSFSRVLKDMRDRENTGNDSFVFDSSILHSIPELMNDVVEPEALSLWMDGGDDGKTANERWRILSIGASRTGLPFHSHGPTWLGLVHGCKRWYIYPPGTGPPYDHYNQTGIISSVSKWVMDFLPMMRDLPVAPMYLPAEKDQQAAQGYRPIEYTQRPGDILFLPSGWAHLTINIGESVAFGAQSSQSATEMAVQAEAALLRSPHNPEALKQRALSAAHLAMQVDSSAKYSISGATLNGMVRIQATSLDPHSKNPNPGASTDFDKLVLQSEDTWLLLVLPISPSEEGKQEVVRLSKIWNSVAGQLKGIMSVGIVEGGALPEDTLEREDCIIFLSFGDRGEGITAREAIASAVMYDPRASTNTEDIIAFALQSMAERPAAKEGSATTVGAKARRLYAKAESYTRSLLKLYPFSPEGHSLLCEVLGHSAKRHEQHAAVQHTIALYDTLKRSEHMSDNAIASLYGSLAGCYLGTDQPRKALPLLQRSLDSFPHYLEAYVDMIAAYSMIDDRKGIEATLDAAEKVGLRRDHPEIRRLLERSDSERSTAGKLAGLTSNGFGREKGARKVPPGRRQMKRIDEL